MHDQVLLVRELPLMQLARWLGPKYAVRLGTRRLPGRLLPRWRFAIKRRRCAHDSGWRAPCASRLAAPPPRRRCRAQAVLALIRLIARQNPDRRSVAGLDLAASGVAWRLDAGSCHVERHGPVTGELATGGRLLRDDETYLRFGMTKGPLKARSQPGAPHSLGRLTGRLPDVVLNPLAARPRHSAVGPSPLVHLLGYCASLGHRRY